MENIYDLRCERCGEQLNFREARDQDKDLVILVVPCSQCCHDQEEQLVEYEGGSFE